MHSLDRSPHSSFSPPVGETFAGSSPLHSPLASAHWPLNSVALARLRERPSLPSFAPKPPSTSTLSSSDSATSSSLSTSSSTLSLAVAVTDMLATSSFTWNIRPEEFDALPPAIQQKHFSSLERLRIAQEAAEQKRRRHFSKPLPDSWTCPRISNDDTIRPRTSHGETKKTKASRSSGTTLPGFSRNRKPCTSRSHADLTEDQALRFQALPAKVKRAHFSQEELVLLTASSERVLGCQSPTYSRCVSPRAINNSLSTTDLNRSNTKDKNWADRELDLVDDMVDDNDIDETDDFLPMQGWHDGRKDSIVQSPDSAPSSPLPIDLKPRAASISGRSISRRRITAMLTPLPLPPPRLRPVAPPLPFPPTSNCSKTQPVPSTTKHYTDFSARSKLRACVMSPEKFDEALEFGFPVTHTASRRSSSDASKIEQSPEDVSELLPLSNGVERSEGENKIEEDDTDESQSGPTTPVVHSTTYQPCILHHDTSIDSGVALPVRATPSYKSSIRSLSPEPATSREMTLKLSLTRSDLRMPEKKLYSIARAQVSGVELAEDPLRLAPLPVCEDHTGAKGAFAVKAKSAKKEKLERVWETVLQPMVHSWY